MKNLIDLVLKEQMTVKNFDKELLMYWNEIKDIQFDLTNFIRSKQIVDIPKEQAINYVELFNLIHTKEDAEYFIMLLKHNLHNKESIGLLLNTAYLIWVENNFTEGIQFFFNWLLDNPNPKETLPFLYCASSHLL